ncbi:flagellar basal body rod protein FlgB [Aureimonas mangrovi]|uniref:flagellar basal body rod protein FlgB n=1 Tax=Aureimonas mangrovi TaxID=2758041 RepID=UPI00163D92F8|nr:flagellar basal body rod protein FlgB [Aureimonas mangrovi]
MSEVYLFGLTARHAEFLATRQSVIAENVANADTPGFRARDVKPFSEVLETTRLEMAGTDRLHMAGGSGRAGAVEEVSAERWDVTHSGNTVSLEQEMMKAGRVAGEYSLNTSITKAFHRMFMSTLRG